MAISSLEMYVADRNAEWLGVPRLVLMENAGAAVARNLLRKFPNASNVLVVCGTGDNGGDGYVAARHLHAAGKRVRVVGLGEPREELARVNFEAVRRLWGVELAVVRDVLELLALQDWFLWADVIVDAVLGTGIRGVLREPQATAIDLMNAAAAPKVAVDVPSGLDPDTGEVRDKAVKAALTVTFHKAKRGLLAPGAERYVGELVVEPIGIPPEAELVVGPGDFAYLNFSRRADSKKGDHGRVLVVGGSLEYSGAPVYVAKAALRGGVDLAVVAAPEPAAYAAKAQGPEVIAIPLEGARLSLKHVDKLASLAERFDVVAMGPGLGTEGETPDAVRELFNKLAGRKPLVVDADAIKALRGVEARGVVVFTPHAGEFKALTGVEPPADLRARAEVVKEWAARLGGAVILLKGRFDVASDGQRVKINATGTPAMTVGGTGDVLTGLVAAFLTKSKDPLEAAAVAAFVNGLAGEEAAAQLGFHITATDLLDRIPGVVKRFAREQVV
ncbi:bifunctional ADP-dependent NAD(P)H-hydrate dehydratase/NAD(P)H-hydrate epimerase [Pyrobaculum calidifontis]|uniref:Bifunctional NAD(P)H-hydrate repair enzyme n=1 Tax=Pyrobaculum calidifontis (strain DSM 21063 / JCM 11548 / VA1) TaxID=410359 RepID=A3MWC2_PYRCJ|nr:bifunctional ADP-dependent NAD(P)H-hydrate dehydratase/NAD(P)H-hydrate epimerase [Pyrobaculum calidifontis]ABO08939.1 carbohydrate kinase, YjeF related protein [Pyrobaculum calidifontis JCM 11548]